MIGKILERASRVLAVCTSEKKGTKKEEKGFVDVKKDWGIEGDGHAGAWHRQVSLLAVEDVKRLEKDTGKTFYPGDFAENILTTGIDLLSLPVGAILDIGSDLRLEITQKGKDCHSDCQIKKETGKCIMPVCGVFARVLNSGRIKRGDNIKVVSTYNFAVVVVSTSCFEGSRVDTAGEAVINLLKIYKYNPIYKVVVPDDKTKIKEELLAICRNKTNPCPLIFTVGGTGLSPDDVTPDATEDIIERRVPGLCELARSTGGKKNPRAYLSRAVCGIREGSLIVNLPGSQRGAEESVAAIVEVLGHALRMLSGDHYHHEG